MKHVYYTITKKGSNGTTLYIKNEFKCVKGKLVIKWTARPYEAYIEDEFNSCRIFASRYLKGLRYQINTITLDQDKILN